MNFIGTASFDVINSFLIYIETEPVAHGEEAAASAAP
jgi:hypothetical protein